MHTGPLDGLVGDFRAVFSAAVNEAFVAGTTGIYQLTGASLVRTSPVSAACSTNYSRLSMKRHLESMPERPT